MVKKELLQTPRPLGFTVELVIMVLCEFMNRAVTNHSTCVIGNEQFGRTIYSCSSGWQHVWKIGIAWQKICKCAFTKELFLIPLQLNNKLSLAGCLRDKSDSLC